MFAIFETDRRELAEIVFRENVLSLSDGTTQHLAVTVSPNRYRLVLREANESCAGLPLDDGRPCGA